MDRTATPAPPSDSRAARALSLLSSVHGVIGARRAGRALLHSLQIRRLAGRWVRAAVLDQHRHRPDDVTVLIGVRNRADHRLALTLRSIRDQTHAPELVHILVVDYGSEPAAAEHTAELCRAHRARYVRVETAGVWSRSRCLNVGIRQATTKYLMTSDVDILLSPGYLSEAVHALLESPLSVICSPMFDLPRQSTDDLRRAADGAGSLPLRQWKGWGMRRLGWESHPSITLTYSVFHQLVRGYDEHYELWGYEDIDLMRRLIKLGLERKIIESDDAFYLHQWHPKYENIPDEGRERTIRKNAERLRQVHTILRNDAGWGLGSQPLHVAAAVHVSPKGRRSTFDHSGRVTEKTARCKPGVDPND